MDFKKMINDSVDTGLKAAHLPDTPENRVAVLQNVYAQLGKELPAGYIRTMTLATIEDTIIDLQNEMYL